MSTKSSAPALFMPVRRSRPGMVGVARLLVLEIIILITVYLMVRGTVAAIVGVVLGVLAIVVVSGRSRGRWWTESAALWLRYRLRSGSALKQSEDMRIAALRQLAPTLTTENIDDARYARLGMGSDGAGWFAVLQVEVSAQDKLCPPIPLGALARIAAEAEQPGVVMQVVTQTSTPITPLTSQAPQGPAFGSRDRVVWVAVRLDAQAVAESVIDETNSRVDIPAVLAEVVRRVERALKRRGIASRALDADEMLDALTRSCDLVPADRSVRAVEVWEAWRSARLVHGCFWLKSWPDAERSAGLLAALSELPTTVTAISVLLEPRYDGTDLRCLIRLAVPDPAYETACSRFTQLATEMQADLFRLDGEHAPAVYAAAPSGGGAG